MCFAKFNFHFLLLNFILCSEILCVSVVGPLSTSSFPFTDFDKLSSKDFALLSIVCSFALTSCRSLTSSVGSNLLFKILFTAGMLIPNWCASLVLLHSAGWFLLKVLKWSIWCHVNLLVGLHFLFPIFSLSRSSFQFFPLRCAGFLWCNSMQ